VYQWPVYHCLYAEIEYDSKQYLLNSSTWYQVDANFRDRIENAFKRIPKATCVLPDAREDEIEREYNKRVAVGDKLQTFQGHNQSKGNRTGAPRSH
jgi:uncharacterized protein (TIGR04141 family)